MAGMDLSPADLQYAIARTRAAWLLDHPRSGESQMPTLLQASEQGSEVMICPWCSNSTTGKGECRNCGLTFRAAEYARDVAMEHGIPVGHGERMPFRSVERTISADSRRAKEHGLQPGQIVYDIPLAKVRELEPFRRPVVGPAAAPAVRSASQSVRKEPVVQNKDQVWAEIETASKAFAGDTNERRIAACLRAHPDLHRAYNEAPLPAPPAPEPPVVPLTFNEAQARFKVTPTSDTAWEVIESKARAYAEEHKGLTREQAVAKVLEREPQLYADYRRLS